MPVGVRSRRPLVIAVAAGVLVLGVLVGGLAVYDRFLKEDSGIAACKAMRDDREQAMDSDGNGEFTEGEYQAIRARFSDSEYDAIREHGRGLVDLVRQMQEMPEDEAMGDLIDEVAEHAAGLQTACADQGIVVNLMDN